MYMRIMVELDAEDDILDAGEIEIEDSEVYGDQIGRGSSLQADRNSFPFWAVKALTSPRPKALI
jgi:hypothetical protein